MELSTAYVLFPACCTLKSPGSQDQCERGYHAKVPWAHGGWSLVKVSQPLFWWAKVETPSIWMLHCGRVSGGYFKISQPATPPSSHLCFAGYIWWVDKSASQPASQISQPASQNAKISQPANQNQPASHPKSASQPAKISQPATQNQPASQPKSASQPAKISQPANQNQPASHPKSAIQPPKISQPATQNQPASQPASFVIKK